MKRVLYLSYDGMTDPLGQSQVIPYVLGLARRGHRITILSFEKPSRYATAEATVRKQLAAEGVKWVPLRYTKRPPVLSTVYDALRMRRVAAKLARSDRFEIVHARSYIPGITAVSLKRRFGSRFIFDMRGFWPDEKAESGAWPQGRALYRAVYRFFKRREEELFSAADGMVSLTHAGFAHLDSTPLGKLATAPRAVIPCSVDFELFRLPTAEQHHDARQVLEIAPDAFVVTYLGSLGSWYMLDEILDLYVAFRKYHHTTAFLCLTPDDAQAVHAAAQDRGIPGSEVIVRSATRSEVARYLAATDVGAFFIRPLPSKVSSSPTKLGEYLAMGIPVVTNGGVGDVPSIVERTGGGVVVDSFSSPAYEGAVDRLAHEATLPPGEIRERARQIYDLERAVDLYDALYAAATAQ